MALAEILPRVQTRRIIPLEVKFMGVTPFVDEVYRACERACLRREPHTVIAVVLGPSDAERVARWTAEDAERLGCVYYLPCSEHAFDVGPCRVKVMALSEAIAHEREFPRGCTVLVDAVARMHATVQGQEPALTALLCPH
jgi:hypothetical protein